MKLGATLALGAALMLPWAAADAAACGAALAAKTRWTIKSSSSSTLQLVFAPRPAPVVVGRHFSLDIVACAEDPGALPMTLRVDAEMPAHRHGMNYAATVTALGGGRFRADGLMFHMPGRWRFLFELTSAAGAHTRLSRELEVE